MQAKHWYCCQVVVIALVLYLFHTTLNTTLLQDPGSVFMPLQTPGQEHANIPPVMPLMGTQHTHPSHTILDCNKEEKQGVIEKDERKTVTGKMSGTLHECSVEVELSPCSCSRNITVRLPEPCPTTSPHSLLQHIKNTVGQSACSDVATLRGAGQRVLSYSVGGLHPDEYLFGAKQLVPQVAKMYPGWVMRLYTDNSTHPYKWMCPLVCTNPHLDMCHVTQLPGLGDVNHSHPRMWRFAVLGDPLVRRYLMRDADSPLLQREVDAVNYWLQAGTCYHVIRDHPEHSVSIPVGLWGGCHDHWNNNTRILNARALALCSTTRNRSYDLSVLQREVWPVARLNATFHDAYNCRKFPGSLPFPTQRINFSFVGQRTYRKWHQKDAVPRMCPRVCRPKEHQDWLYC